MTNLEHALLCFIIRRQRATGMCPSLREGAAHTGLSPSGVKRLLDRLEAWGYLRRLPRRHRAIQITRLPGPRAYALRGEVLTEIPFHSREGEEAPRGAAESGRR